MTFGLFHPRRAYSILTFLIILSAPLLIFIMFNYLKIISSEKIIDS